MELDGTNLTSLVQFTQMNSTISFTEGGVQGFRNNQIYGNDFAACFNVNAAKGVFGFDEFAKNMVAFNDMLFVAQDKLEAMQAQGESIRDLVAKAKEDGCSEETLDALQKEVNARIAEIHKIRDAADYCGVNPFNGAISVGIPNWQDMLGMQEEDEEAAKNEIVDMLASFDIDMNINGGFFNLGGTATINIGYTEDGSLQITVDTAFDFDLSELESLGIQDENAMDIINNFLALLTGQQQGMNNASNFVGSMFMNASASIMGNGFAIDASNEINMDGDSSSALKGQIIQHAAITLDSTANQSPSIAINLL